MASAAPTAATAALPVRRCAGCGSRTNGLFATLPCGCYLCYACHHVSVYIAHSRNKLSMVSEVKADGVMRIYSPLCRDRTFYRHTEKNMYFEPAKNRYTLVNAGVEFPCGYTAENAVWQPACPSPGCAARRFRMRPACEQPGCNVHRTFDISSGYVYDQGVYCRAHEVSDGSAFTRVVRARLCVAHRIGRGFWQRSFFDVLMIYDAPRRIGMVTKCSALTKAGQPCRYTGVSGNGGTCRVHSRDDTIARLVNAEVMSSDITYANYASRVAAYADAGDPERVVDLSAGVKSVYATALFGSGDVSAEQLEAAWESL